MLFMINLFGTKPRFGNGQPDHGGKSEATVTEMDCHKIGLRTFFACAAGTKDGTGGVKAVDTPEEMLISGAYSCLNPIQFLVMADAVGNAALLTAGEAPDTWEGFIVWMMVPPFAINSPCGA